MAAQSCPVDLAIIVASWGVEKDGCSIKIDVVRFAWSTEVIVQLPLVGKGVKTVATCGVEKESCFADFFGVIHFDSSFAEAMQELSHGKFFDTRYEGWSEDAETCSHHSTAYFEHWSDDILCIDWALWINCSILFTNVTQLRHATSDLVSSSEIFMPQVLWTFALRSFDEPALLNIQSIWRLPWESPQSLQTGFLGEIVVRAGIPSAIMTSE